MKSKIFIFTTLILVVFLFVITSCDNFLNAKNKTTININLDLSKILKTSRNETTTSITDYILKVFAYNAAAYKPEAEIQNLPLLTQTENKVDINGNVKASLDIEIGLNVIFVAKLYQGKSEKPLYAGKSEVIKIKATNNKVHLVLTSENTDLDIDILVHDHTFATDWTSDDTYHWHSATCEHTTEVSDKAEHFGIWKVEITPTGTTEGTSKRICSICNFEETKSIIAIPENFALIPADTFQMGSIAGSDSQKPVHEVTITKPFYMGKYEVTQAEYEKYCSYTEIDSPSSSYGDGDNYPAYNVSWYDALVYCNKRSMAEGLTPCYSISDSTNPEDWGDVPTSSNSIWNAVVCDWNANGYRLPTEAEWEYAARAGDNTVDSLTYSGTNNVDELVNYAWYESNSSDKTHPVGTKEANDFGLYDMSGNVCECCWNWETSSYDTDTEGGSDPTGASSGSYRVFRGGGWNIISVGCAVSYRFYSDPNDRYSYLGFRVVRTATEVIENLAHTHKFATEWTKDETHHWHAATCGHDVTDSKAEHTFGEYVSNNDATTEADGTKTRECSVCGYKDTVTDDGSKIIVPEMVSVNGGTVTGALPAWLTESDSDQDKGVFIKDRTVTLSDFYMGKYEVTQEEYASVMEGQKVTVEEVEYTLESNPNYCTADSTNYTLFNGDVQEKRPVEGVTWYDAVWYCNALSEKEGLTKAYDIEVTQVKQTSGKTGYYIYSANVTLNKNANGYRLPTEAEWEYAARGGDPTKEDWNYVFSGADTAAGVSYESDKNEGLDSVGWYCYNSKDGTTGDYNVLVEGSGKGTHQVGKKDHNRLGLYDMSGNVAEWCWDWYGDISDSTAADGVTSGDYRVFRSGSWASMGSYCQVAFRNSSSPYGRGYFLGFRVVRTAPE